MDRNEVINKVFPHSLFGYDPIAVDAFLDEVIREFDRLNNTIDVLQFRMAHELGDAYHQNDVLSRELEYARFGRRVDELLAAPAGIQLPEPASSTEGSADAAGEAVEAGEAGEAEPLADTWDAAYAEEPEQAEEAEPAEEEGE